MFRCPRINNGIIKAKNRIIVIGDLHADYHKAVKIFIDLNIIDYDMDWICEPKDTVIVQLGDQLDGGGRGKGNTRGDELRLIEFMDIIHQKANVYGGGVYSLIGNHEIMNLLGDFRYASKNDIQKQGGLSGRKKLFSPGSDIFNRMSCTRNVVLKVGNFIFCHAGVLPEHLDKKDNSKFIEKINILMRHYLQGHKDWDTDDIQKYFLSKSGLIWNRDYGKENPNCQDFEYVTKMLKVDHMIIGHTVQDSINSKCNKKLWRVDVGISDAFGKTNGVQVLEILDNGEPTPSNNFKPIKVLSI